MSEVRGRHTPLFVTKVGGRASFGGNSDPSVPFPARRLQFRTRCDSFSSWFEVSRTAEDLSWSARHDTPNSARKRSKTRAVLFRTCLRYTARLEAAGPYKGTVAFSACLGGSCFEFSFSLGLTPSLSCSGSTVCQHPARSWLVPESTSLLRLAVCPATPLDLGDNGRSARRYTKWIKPR
jgi:hypothetical protein